MDGNYCEMRWDGLEEEVKTRSDASQSITINIKLMKFLEYKEKKLYYDKRTTFPVFIVFLTLTFCRLWNFQS